MCAAAAFTAAATATSACGDDGPSAPPPGLDWAPDENHLGAFPDDAFTAADPAARTGLRPNVDPEALPELERIPASFKAVFAQLNTLDGWGVTAGVALRFTVPIDGTKLVSGPATASFTGVPIVLAVEDPDPAAPAGTLVPWAYEVQTLVDDGTTLILEPMKPLPARARVVVALGPGLTTADGQPLARSAAMRDALGERDPATLAERSPRLARVAARQRAAADALVAAGFATSRDELAAVIVYTTQSLYEDATAIAAHVAGRAIAPRPGITCTPEALWIRCEGLMPAVDYRGADGFIEDILSTGANPAPDASLSYDLPFTVWLPLERPGPWGGTAFPTLVFGHGLGGERQQAEKLAQFAAPRGIATIAVDAVRHAGHPTATADTTLFMVLDFFGISTEDLSVNPLTMRENWRQSAFDKLQLVRMLEGGLDLDGDQVVDLDAERLGFLGVSLGGIMGPELLALAPRLRLAVLVVGGGRASSIVRDSAQFAPLIDLLRPDEATDGDVQRFFPVLQTLIERGDAAVWAAPLLLPVDGARPPGFPAGAAPHVLGAMVLDDDTVPNSSNRALARAFGLPVVPPVRQEVGLVATTAAAPVKDNLPDGRTAGLLQLDRVQTDDLMGFEPATHSNIGDSTVGIAAWLAFVEGWLGDGHPVIVDPYVELGL